MEFDWDDEKRQSNIRKHGFDFIDVWQIFDADHIVAEANPGSGGGRAVSCYWDCAWHLCHRHLYDARRRGPDHLAPKGKIR